MLEKLKIMILVTHAHHLGPFWMIMKSVKLITKIFILISKLSESDSPVFIIIEKYDYYLKDRISFDEFYSEFLSPSLITNRKYKNDLSNINTNSLDLLLTNIKDRYDSYRRHWDLGNEQEARKERKEAILVASEIVKKLEDIRENISIKKYNTTVNTIANNDAVIIRDSVQDLSLRNEDWDVLLDSIKSKKCIPFLGAELFSPWLPIEGKSSGEWTKDLSEQWTEEYGYPFEDSSQLSRVTQFIAIDNGDLMYPKKMIGKMLREIDSPNFAATEFNDTPYAVLADLNLPIYITTNYDHFMEAALEKRNEKKTVTSENCRWNDKVKMYLKRAGMESLFGRGSKYKPTPDTPLVYHLHGDMDIPQSMVLTERDYIDFIINISIEGERAILPSAMLKELATSSLLFIGYNLEEMNFRIIFQGVLGLQVGDLRETSVAVQLPPRLTSDKEKKALKYLQEYTKGMNVHVYWGNISDFCRELRQRLVI
jgi:hypothetical protein